MRLQYCWRDSIRLFRKATLGYDGAVRRSNQDCKPGLDEMSERNCLAIVLAAGEGTRMRSARPKVLHEVAGRSLLAHVLSAVAAADIAMTAVVVGPGADAVTAEAERALPGTQVFVQ